MAKLVKKIDSVKTRIAKEESVKMKVDGECKEVVYQQEVVLVRSQPSVVIKDDGKGRLQVEVKCYADTIDEAVKNAIKSYNKLKKELRLEDE